MISVLYIASINSSCSFVSNIFLRFTSTLGKQVELLQLLLEEGCSPIQTNTLTLTSALHIAVKKRDIQCVNLLLEYGADPLLVDKVR